MPQENLFQFIGREFPAAGIRWVLIGGFAVNYHGVSRYTGDVDLLIDSNDYPAARQVLERIGYEEYRRTDAFARLRSKSLLLMGVDITFVGAATFAKIWQAGVPSAIGEVPVRVAAIEHLLAMKLHALKYGHATRQRKDLDDVRQLAEILRLEIRSDEFRQLCQRYGDDKVYQLIVRP